MRILLCGDYSGVHSELGKELKRMGHNVVVLSGGDGYKSFERDIDIPDFESNVKVLNVFCVILDFFGLKGLISYFKHRKKIKNLKGFDVVQLINPIVISAFGSLLNALLIRRLRKNNSTMFLCALGDDYQWVDMCLKNKLKYSPFDKMSFFNLHRYIYSLKYKFGLFFRYNHKVAKGESSFIIPGLLDYDLAYDGDFKKNKIIKIPLSREIVNGAKENIKKLESNINCGSSKRKVIVFHGWQKGKELRKGNDVFDEAVTFLKEKYGEEIIDYSIVSGLPYSEYIKRFNQSDIFLDQIYSYDRGVNALLGMAEGKVVFSGFEFEKNINSNITEIGVNAVPDVKVLISDLESVILDRKKMQEIKLNALKYVVKNHDPTVIAKEYIALWESVRK